jgi:hypothetical protein
MLAAMRYTAPLAAAILLGAATPAFATGSIHCTQAGRPGFSLYLSVGGGPGPSIVSASLADGRERFTTGERSGSPVIAQAWLSDTELRLDIVDSNAERFVLRLNGRKLRGDLYAATMSRNGRASPVRCSWDE